MTEELKPCPFCGGGAKITIQDVEPQGDPHYGRKEERFVQCQKCGCALFDVFFHEGFYRDEAAAEAWNTRAESDEVARLKARVAELEAGLTWQPMETAPRDGTEILASFHGVDCVVVASWDDETKNREFPWSSLENGHYHADAFRAWLPVPPPEES